ncbi:MAG TPA: hypothetical protein VGD67_02185 [Pseudonocardiaceae bacterium]
MPELQVSEAVHADLRLLAKAMGTDEDGVIRRLIEYFRSPAAEKSGDRGMPPPERRIHALYEGHRVEAAYHPPTQQVRILDGPLAGRTFRSPSGAAIAVVSHLKPDVHPNRNGWTFWTLTDSGHLLQSIRPNSLRGDGHE